MATRDSGIHGIAELTDDNFDSSIASSKYAIVDFWSGSCMSCRTVLRIIEELSEKYPTVLFGKVNIANNRAVTSKYRILTIPTLLLFRDGKKIARIMGPKALETYEEAIKRYFLTKGIIGTGQYDDAD